MKTTQNSLLRRLSRYLLVLRQETKAKHKVISSEFLGKMSNTHSSQVRRDLGAIDLHSRPRVGISVKPAIKTIEKFLHIDRLNSAFLVGVGNIGKALLKHDYQNFGMEILAGFDIDLSLSDTQIGGIKIFPLEKFQPLTQRMNVHIGIICTPPSEAQKIAETMQQANIRAIWNFSPVHLQLPSEITVENVDLYSGLAVLSKLTSQRRDTSKAKRS